MATWNLCINEAIQFYQQSAYNIVFLTTSLVSLQGNLGPLLERESIKNGMRVWPIYHFWTGSVDCGAKQILKSPNLPLGHDTLWQPLQGCIQINFNGRIKLHSTTDKTFKDDIFPLNIEFILVVTHLGTSRFHNFKNSKCTQCVCHGLFWGISKSQLSDCLHRR